MGFKAIAMGFALGITLFLPRVSHAQKVFDKTALEKVREAASEIREVMKSPNLSGLERETLRNTLQKLHEADAALRGIFIVPPEYHDRKTLQRSLKPLRT
jgi:hypothetical protein